MTQHFRRLTLDDKHDYLTLMLAAYAPIKALGIQFDAATADLVRVTQHLDDHAVFALFDDQRMVASVTLRFPWGACLARWACRILAGLARIQITPVRASAKNCWAGWKTTF
jgi:hypothetical protein